MHLIFEILNIYILFYIFQNTKSNFKGKKIPDVQGVYCISSYIKSRKLLVQEMSENYCLNCGDNYTVTTITGSRRSLAKIDPRVIT